MAVKGIPETALWAINWKIFKQGIAAVPFLEQSIKEIEKKYIQTLQSDKFINVFENEWGKKLQNAFKTEATKYSR
jgi:hypothetical protein